MKTTIVAATKNLEKAGSVFSKRYLQKAEEKVHKHFNHFLEKGYSKDEISHELLVEVEENPNLSAGGINLRAIIVTRSGEITKSDLVSSYTETIQLSADNSKVENETLKPAIFDIQEKKRIAQEKLKKEREAEQAERESKNREYEAKKAALKEWALKNGSELLKARIDENLNWFDLANDEYFISIIPKGFGFEMRRSDEWDIKNATLEQIKALREVKVKFPDAKLVRVKIDDSDDDYPDTVSHFDIIQIKLSSLSGSVKYAEKVLGEYFPDED